MKEKVERQNISLYPREWELLDQFKELYGLASRSAAIRFLLVTQITTKEVKEEIKQPAVATSE